MRKSALSLMVTAAIMGSPLLLSAHTQASTHERASTTARSESVFTLLNVTNVTQWYSNADIELKNTSGQPLDLNGAEIWVTSNKSASINNVWGAPFTVSSPSPNTFVFKHDGTSHVLGNGESIHLLFVLDASNGDYIGKNDVSIEKVVIKNDPALQGKMVITAPSSPHESLNGSSVLIEGESFSETVSVPWGGRFVLDHLQDGDYQVTTLDVKSELGVAQALSPTSTVTVNGDSTVPSIDLQYDAFIHYAALSLAIPALESVSGHLSTNATIRISGSNEIERSVAVPFGGTTEIHKLLDDRQYDLSYTPITVNNVRYQPKKNVGVLLDDEKVTSLTIKLNKKPLESDGFRTVRTRVIDLPKEALPIQLNLVARNGSQRYHYEINQPSFTLPDNVKPGKYDIQIDSVFNGHTRYVYDGKPTVSVKDGSTAMKLKLPFRQAMSLAVKGFPDYVANGTVTNDSEQATTQIGATKVNALFKYAGLSGSGDPGTILPKDTLPLHRTYANAKNASALSGQHVLPVMVVYTANASGGASWTDLVDNELLYKHYATFITQAVAAQEYAAGDGSSPMSFVLNPDFLGELQKNPSHVDDLNRAGAVEVNAQLKRALNYMKTTYGYEPPINVPQFEDTLKGYIASLNFIMNALAKDVTYGWQINLWAVGSANWIHQTDDQANDKGQDVANFVNSLDVYSGVYKPDYIVFDKYERDGFGSEAIANYAYNATSWKRYLSYVKTISNGVASPAMIWQIPGGHMPTQEEGNSLISVNHEASGGSFFMGDARIGSNINNIRAGLLDKSLSPNIYNGSGNVRELLEKDNGYDWSHRAINDLPKSNVFALLWGGGSTTAVVSIGSNGNDKGWLQDKIDAYAQNPTCLVDNQCDGSIWGGEDDEKPSLDNQAPSVSLPTNYQVNSGESVTIHANASDPDGDQLHYQWSVPANLTVLGNSTSDTLVFTAPVTNTNMTFSISLIVSDGALSVYDSTNLKVLGDNGDNGGNDDGICANVAEFIQKQYEPGKQVTYQGNLYQSERWTDGAKTPADLYAGWKLIGSCS